MEGVEHNEVPLTIRKLEITNAEEYFKFINENREHFANFENMDRDRYADVEEVESEFKKSDFFKDRWGIYDESATLVGSVNATYNARKEDATEALIGYLVAKTSGGKGYATHATQHVIESLRVRGLKKLRAGTHPDNLASQRVLTKAGFTKIEEDDTDVLFELILN